MDALFVFLLGCTFIVVMFSGYPVAFVLGGVAVAFAALGTVLDNFAVVDADMASLRMVNFVANRIFNTLSSYSLIPMSMFIFMGLMLEKSGAAEKLLTKMHKVPPVPGGMAVAVVVIGVVLAASTEIIGASVVLLATIAMPAMPAMRTAGYKDTMGLGVVGATGCLGILIPPSIMLIVMGDQLQIPVGDLFRGAILPGFLLALAYIVYVVAYALWDKEAAPALERPEKQPLGMLIKELSTTMIRPLLQIVAVLGSIVFGVATPTEASGIGAAGATLIALSSKKLNWATFREVCDETALTTAFLFGLIFGASCFSVVLRGYGGDELIEGALFALPLSADGTLVFILFIVFMMGFFLDWMEIILIIAPLVFPVLLALGHEPACVAILMAICLKTSFLTPPVGMALFYLSNSVPDVEIKTIYRSVMPFIAIQASVLLLAFMLPKIVLW